MLKVPNPEDKVRIFIFILSKGLLLQTSLHFPKSFIFLKGINSETGRRQYRSYLAMPCSLARSLTEY